MSAERINRLIRLVIHLQSGQAGSADELADLMGVSRRTLFRDLGVLKEAGIPYYHQPGHGYRVGQSYYLPPINLTVTETLALLLLGKTAAASRDKPMMRNALSAINKLVVSVPDSLREACCDLMANITVDGAGQTESFRESQFYLQLSQGIDQARVCRVGYKSPAMTEPDFWDMKPYAMHFSGRGWYVFGRTDQHEEVRMFKLARFTSIELSDRKFTLPREPVVQQKIGKAWQLIPEGKIYKIELRFTPKVATNVIEVRWHESQQYTRAKDGSVAMQLEVDGLREIAWWICGYAGEVKVIKPKALATMVKRMHEDAARRYD